MGKSSVSPTAIGRIGETLVLLELEKRGWMVFLPHFEKGIDIVAVKQLDEQVRYVRAETANGYHRGVLNIVPSCAIPNGSTVYSFQYLLQNEKR